MVRQIRARSKSDDGGVFGHQKSLQVPRHEDHFWANVLDFVGPF